MNGASVQATHPVTNLVTRGEHEHRRPYACLAQPLAQLEAVETGQHDVQDDGRIGVLRRQPQAVRPGPGDVHGVAFLLERALEQPRHPHLVLDYQHPHTAEATQRQM